MHWNNFYKVRNEKIDRAQYFDWASSNKNQIILTADQTKMSKGTNEKPKFSFAFDWSRGWRESS